jgi:hypothetical protein
MYGFTFDVFTTASYDSLVYGHQLDFDDSLNADAVRDRILRTLRGNRRLNIPNNVELLVYLPGGLPFLGRRSRVTTSRCPAAASRSTGCTRC